MRHKTDRGVGPLIERLRLRALAWQVDENLDEAAADCGEAATALEDQAEAVEYWTQRWRHERTHGCPHWGNHTSDGRDRVCWYGGRDRFERDEKTIRAMVAWLEKNQPDVFKRGMWDAINAKTTP